MDGLVVRDTVTPMDLIQQARQQNATIEQMQQLFDLKLRFDADEARKAFSEAFAAFKAEAVVIVKNVTVNDGPLKGKKHADLFGVVSAVTPALSKHGLSHSWKLTRDDREWMEVTCTIRHEQGYSESVSMGAAPDTGPGRNAIQARGSAKTYLERYTLMAALGLAAAGTDDDGAGTAPQRKRVPAEETDRVIALMQEARTLDALKVVYGEAYNAAKALGDDATMKQLIKAYGARKAEVL